MKFVMDASAVLALLNDEPGADFVGKRLSDSVISAVNSVEVGSKLVDSGMSFEAARQAMDLLRIPIANFDEAMRDTTIKLRETTRATGLSLADRACLALAIRENAIAVTADRVWASVDAGCKIELIR